MSLLAVPARRSRAPRLLAALVAAAALSGCSADEGLDVDGFAPGTCTELVPTLQDVDEALRRVEDEELSPGEAAQRLEAAQQALGAARSGAEPRVATSLEALVTRLGFYRISVDTNSYGDKQARDVSTALEGVGEACRGT